MQKKKPYGETLKEQLRAGARDRLYNFILAGGAIRGVIMNGTRMVNEMRANHALGILETLVLGRAYLGAALMSADLKSNDRISIKSAHSHVVFRDPDCNIGVQFHPGILPVASGNIPAASKKSRLARCSFPDKISAKNKVDRNHRSLPPPRRLARPGKRSRTSG